MKTHPSTHSFLHSTVAAVAFAALAGLPSSTTLASQPPGPDARTFAAAPKADDGAGGIARAPKASDETFDVLVAMARRAEEQQMLLQKSKVLWQFRMTDRYSGSGVAFENRVVDDAARDWVAGHYDHGNSVSVADVDGDGRLDLYFCSQLGGNQLYRNTGNGHFENITRTAGVGLEDRVNVAGTFADFDNDGDPDLFCTTVKMGNAMFENVGQGRFKDITKAAGLEYVGHSSGAVFFDFNNDGLLDLFVCNVGKYTIDRRGRQNFFLTEDEAFLGHMHPERTETGILYQNMGNKTFRDVSKETGLVDTSWNGDAAIVDVNGDGFMDIYLTNMQGDDHLWVNQGGKKFVEQTAKYFPKTPWGAMGVKFFDFDQDGKLDLYVTDMHSDMTDKQSADSTKDIGLKFEKARSEKYCSIEWSEAILQGSSNNVFGNALYLNKGKEPWEEASARLNGETYWPWGFSVGDLNADGYPDAFVAGGMGYPFRYGINSVLLNEGGGRFVDAEFAMMVEPRANNRINKPYFMLDCDGEDKANPMCKGQSGRIAIEGAISTRGAVMFDIDDDGDLDLVTNEFNDRPQMLFNELERVVKFSYLKIKLVGTKSNRDGIGAMVRVKAGGKTWTQMHDGKAGYLAQSSLPLYFGLGATPKADSIEVTWPNGHKQTVSSGIPANGLFTITEPK